MHQSQAALTCQDDTLTVTWDTDVIFNGAVTKLPDDLNNRIRNRLIDASKFQILQLVVISKTPQ